jgi:hypothetical protein
MNPLRRLILSTLAITAIVGTIALVANGARIGAAQPRRKPTTTEIVRWCEKWLPMDGQCRASAFPQYDPAAYRAEIIGQFGATAEAPTPATRKDQ